MARGRQAASQWLVLVALLCFGAVGFALFAQYRLDMLPCPWCTLQRLIFLVIGVLALLAAAVRGLRKPLAGLGLLLSLAGVASALWQHFYAAASASCNLTLADKILDKLGLFELAPSVFAPMASCADAAVNLLGVPFAFWSLALFALCGLIWVQTLRRV
ncbi:disulfide bond formation protein B [Ideonella azotifigens]|uniref:Disulfide bond formation protein B n=1 Tax=Ideonella azotifigens TaxID=513160 RepID=A0ABN1KD52_9BURK|nr:disulfide bond formation protein B [Ideonella azotifigens]MCD2343722.1 disulfide bond formation protein B [Ideonella azotifigens]